MIAAGLQHNLIELFSGMSVVTFILVALGLMLIVIEFFQPAHRISAYCGAALTFCGIAVRMLSGGTLVMLFFMVFFCAVVLLAAHILKLFTQKKAWLATSLALKLERSVQEEADGYSYILGREGVATTDISGNGHMSLDNVNFFVSSEEFIAKGSTVRVVHVFGDSIRVVPVYDEV
ncbi:NfeD family protein [Pumilibacter muris]|uniref:NfeD family protein n=1 Tax=Pumilibacter muris TaxID=2941510 RepID=UPI002041EC06|nr:NfeD family protein [Pumilibacter muris]